MNQHRLTKHPINSAIAKIMSTLLSQFVKKWSNHTHKNSEKSCNDAVVYDGNWKLSRLKCVYDQVWYKSNEYGEIQIGCPNTPNRNSYYCSLHSNYELSFFVNGVKRKVKPCEIRISKKSRLLVLNLREYSRSCN